MDLLTFIRNSKLSISDKALWEDVLIPLPLEQFEAFEKEINNDESALISMTEEIKTLAGKGKQAILDYAN